MEEYPGAELSLTQLVYVFEERLSLMKNRSRPDVVLDEEEINWVVSRLSSISANACQLKNSFVPINRLPPETLALIPTFRESERDLISATAVCSHWRRTLISTPCLWNNIVCNKRERTGVFTPRIQAYLERSGTVPIDVQIHARASQLIAPDIRRISSLRLFVSLPPPDLEDIAEHLSKPAPLLKTIGLNVKGCEEPTLGLPPTFLETFRSSVRALTLHGILLSPSPRPLEFPQVTKFILTTNFRASVPSGVLLDTLERMPLLQLFEATFTSQPDLIPGHRVVTLPHLEQITLTSNLAHLVPLKIPILPVLCLPRARRVNVRSLRNTTISDAPILPSSFEEQLPNLSAMPEVSVTLGNEFKLEFSGPGQSGLTLFVGTPGFIFTRSMFGGAPFGSVRKLRSCFPRRAVDWVPFVEVLRAMGGLEWLEMERNIGGPLTYWAGMDKQAEICPALKMLVITNPTIDASGCVQLFELARERAGVPIAHVQIGMALRS